MANNLTLTLTAGQIINMYIDTTGILAQEAKEKTLAARDITIENANYVSQQVAIITDLTGTATSSANASVNAAQESIAAKNLSVGASGTATSAAADAVQAKTDAEAARDTTISAKNDAVTAKTDAQTAKTATESARDIAVTAKEDTLAAKEIVLTAEGNAQTYATNAGESATDAAGSASQANLSAVQSADIAKMYRQKGTPYTPGEIVYGALNLAKGFVLWCKTGGTTSPSDIATWGAVNADTTDGTVVWTTKSAGDLLPVLYVTANTTLLVSQMPSYVNCTGTATYTVTMPTPATANGGTFVVRNANSVAITLATPAGSFLGPHGSATTSLSLPPGVIVELYTGGSNWVVTTWEDNPTITGTSPITVTTDVNNNKTIAHGTSGIAAGTYNGLTVTALGHVTGFTQPTTFVGNFTENVQALGTILANTTINCALGSIVTATVGASLTFTFTAGATTSTARVLTLILTGASSYTIAWPTNVKWDSGSAPTLSALDMLTFITTNNGTTWIGSVNGGDIA